MINSIIPKLNEAVRIYPFDAQHILVECNNHQLKLKKDFEILISLVNGTNNIKYITEQYYLKTEQRSSEEFIHKVLFRDLATYGIIKSDIPIKTRERSLHLRLSFIFWKGRSLDVASHFLSFLFNTLSFYLSLLLMFLFVISTIFYYRIDSIKEPFAIKNILLYAFFSFIVLMLHELGHVAACNKFGAKHKGIGFGFYLFSPVFFADVSDAWKLPKSERLIVNFAGIYIEFLIITLLYILFLFTHNPVLLYIGIAILIHIAVNLNPFLKYDGYWILSDITNTSNLRSQSNERFRKLFSINKARQFSAKDIALVIYALLSYVIIIIVLVLVFFNDSQSILNFPINLFNTIINIENINVFNDIEFSEMLVRNTIPVMFYFFTIRFLYNTLKSYLRRKKLAYEK